MIQAAAAVAFRSCGRRTGSCSFLLKETWGRSPVARLGRAYHSDSDLSISQGPSQPPLLPHTIPEHFSSIVSQHGDRPAVICRSPGVNATEATYSYSSLDQATNALAHALRALGVKKGDRVAVSLGNCAEFAVITYAVFKLGAVLVPLNPGFNAQQVTAALAHLGVELLIIGAVTDLAYKPCRGRSNLPLLQALVPDLSSGRVEAPAVPSLKRVVVVDNTLSHPDVTFSVAASRSLLPFSMLVNDFPANNPTASRSVTPDEPLSASDTINIQFTSGTTAQPKAAMLSHTSILNNGALIAHRMGLTPADKIVCPPPLFHCFGSVLGYMATATTGASILFSSPAFDPLASLEMVRDHQATGLYGVATMFVAMLEALASSSSSSSSSPASSKPSLQSVFPAEHLRTGIAAGSPVPEALIRRLHATLGLRDLVNCYGMTETSPVSCMTTPADALAKRTQTVGRAMPHTRVKVVDPHDRSRVLPRGARGELAAAGYLVMKGYWDDEARTRECRAVEPDGVWMYSGDEARMDAEGYVAITGRIKDLIVRGGENINPLEIENCLFRHPLVAEASVVGVPDERLGEIVGAFVVVHRGVRAVEADAVSEAESQNTEHAEKVLTRGDVREWVRTHLSGHLVPKYVFWNDEYPKTASGKIQKYKLRELAAQLVSGEQSSDVKS